MATASASQQPHYASTGIACIALISARNTPIYLRAFPSSSSAASAASSSSAPQHTNVRYEYIANAALDLVEERTSRHAEHYLGLLMTMEDLAVYGFQTSSRIKILVMLPATDLFVRDIDLLTIFRALHTAYLSYIANPFHLLPPIIPRTPTPTSTTIFNPTPSPHTQPPSIFSTDSSLEQVSALQSLSCRPIRSEMFEGHVEKVVGWTEVVVPSTVVGGGRTVGMGKPLGGGEGAGGIGAGQNPAVPVS
ncbi:hypothetical protein CF327_g519 [Tilletia walkeri]|uniref:Trafficking protein particle complex subunit 2-like protein n=1 Tax=Tilletia walkeri TaxID=117179 RepID=A0A8X7N194_9BASI|nr:hypothetical protein CF327_g519 [Tilletia walkeri]KAE8263641.1 hypothetical protein A4X09_0g7177 [Tilletia walkeri]